MPAILIPVIAFAFAIIATEVEWRYTKIPIKPARRAASRFVKERGSLSLKQTLTSHTEQTTAVIRLMEQDAELEAVAIAWLTRKYHRRRLRQFMLAFLINCCSLGAGWLLSGLGTPQSVLVHILH